MNQLTKLIDELFYKTILQVRTGSTESAKKVFETGIEQILASHPTCGEEQRKFLDGIEKMSEYIPPRKTYDRMEISASIIGSHEKDPYCYELWQCDFTADLSKVIRGE